MIYEISQMIDLLDSFYDNIGKRVGVIGAIAGTQIEEYVLSSAEKYAPFQKTLILNGCQDYLAALKQPIRNVKFWCDVLTPKILDTPVPIDPFQPKILTPKIEWDTEINSKMLSAYDSCIVFNAHLIPSVERLKLVKGFCGKILLVVDPVELVDTLYGLDEFVDPDMMPVLVDTLDKVTPMIAMARDIIGCETRSINRRAPGTLNHIQRINKRTIGKIDDKQYIVDDWDLCQEINDRQKDGQMKKGQKFMVSFDRLGTIQRIPGNDLCPDVTLRTKSMIVLVDFPKVGSYMKFRLYNGKDTFTTRINYRVALGNPLSAKLLEKDAGITVVPANVILIDNAKYHRFNHAVFIEKYPISVKQKYSLLKNCNNLTIVSKS